MILECPSQLGKITRAQGRHHVFEWKRKWVESSFVFS
jgi:hypothetical protein